MKPQKQSLSIEQKEKLLLSFIKQDYKENKEQYWEDLDLFNKECARYYALEWKKPIEWFTGYHWKKWICVKTRDFWWITKHVLRNEFEKFSNLTA